MDIISDNIILNQRPSSLSPKTPSPKANQGNFADPRGIRGLLSPSFQKERKAATGSARRPSPKSTFTNDSDEQASPKRAPNSPSFLFRPLTVSPDGRPKASTPDLRPPLISSSRSARSRSTTPSSPFSPKHFSSPKASSTMPPRPHTSASTAAMRPHPLSLSWDGGRSFSPTASLATPCDDHQMADVSKLLDDLARTRDELRASRDRIQKMSSQNDVYKAHMKGMKKLEEDNQRLKERIKLLSSAPRRPSAVSPESSSGSVLELSPQTGKYIVKEVTKVQRYDIGVQTADHEQEQKTLLERLRSRMEENFRLEINRTKNFAASQISETEAELNRRMAGRDQEHRDEVARLQRELQETKDQVTSEMRIVKSLDPDLIRFLKSIFECPCDADFDGSSEGNDHTNHGCSGGDLPPAPPLDSVETLSEMKAQMIEWVDHFHKSHHVIVKQKERERQEANWKAEDLQKEHDYQMSKCLFEKKSAEHTLEVLRTQLKLELEKPKLDGEVERLVTEIAAKDTRIMELEQAQTYLKRKLDELEARVLSNPAAVSNYESYSDGLSHFHSLQQAQSKITELQEELDRTKEQLSLAQKLRRPSAKSLLHTPDSHDADEERLDLEQMISEFHRDMEAKQQMISNLNKLMDQMARGEFESYRRTMGALHRLKDAHIAHLEEERLKLIAMVRETKTQLLEKSKSFRTLQDTMKAPNARRQRSHKGAPELVIPSTMSPMEGSSPPGSHRSLSVETHREERRVSIGIIPDIRVEYSDAED